MLGVCLIFDARCRPTIRQVTLIEGNVPGTTFVGAVIGRHRVAVSTFHGPIAEGDHFICVPDDIVIGQTFTRRRLDVACGDVRKHKAPDSQVHLLAHRRVELLPVFAPC